MSRNTERAQELSTLAATPNPLSPLMSLDIGTVWLREYFAHEPPFVPGDDFATCYTSYAAVMLTAMVIGTESPVILAGVTSYPCPFVSAVCNSMRRDKLWSLDDVIGLRALLEKNTSDRDAISGDLNGAMESVWSKVWSHEARCALESLRRGVLFGGSIQHWLDEDAAWYFGLV